MSKSKSKYGGVAALALIAAIALGGGSSSQSAESKPEPKPEPEPEPEPTGGELSELFGSVWGALEEMLQQAGYGDVLTPDLWKYARAATESMAADAAKDPSYGQIVQDYTVGKTNTLEAADALITWTQNRGVDMAAWVTKTFELYSADQGGGPPESEECLKIPAFDAIVPDWDDLDDAYKDPDFFDIEAPGPNPLGSYLFRVSRLRYIWDTWRSMASAQPGECSEWDAASLSAAAGRMTSGPHAVNVGLGQGQVHPLVLRMALELFKATRPGGVIEPSDATALETELTIVGYTLSPP